MILDAPELTTVPGGETWAAEAWASAEGAWPNAAKDESWQSFGSWEEPAQPMAAASAFSLSWGQATSAPTANPFSLSSLSFESSKPTTLAAYSWAPMIDEWADEAWQRVDLVVDSGAAKSACPIGLAPEVDVKESRASLAHMRFNTASGESIAAMGTKTPAFQLNSGAEVSVAFECCGIDKALLSVSAMNDKGHDVVFTARNGAWIGLASGQWERLVRRDGVFLLPVWLRPGQGGVDPPSAQILAPMGFRRQGSGP